MSFKFVISIIGKVAFVVITILQLASCELTAGVADGISVSAPPTGRVGQPIAVEFWEASPNNDKNISNPRVDWDMHEKYRLNASALLTTYSPGAIVSTPGSVIYRKFSGSFIASSSGIYDVVVENYSQERWYDNFEQITGAATRSASVSVVITE